MFKGASSRMRLLILVVSALATGITCAVAAVVLCGQSGGERELTYNAGYVRAGQKVTYEFEIVNRSRSLIRIDEVKANCRCHLPKEIGQTVPAKGVCKLPMTIDTEGLSGAQSAIALVRLENGHEVRCVLQCNVVSGYPKTVSFPDMLKGDEIATEFYLRNLPGESVRIEEIDYPDDYFSIQWSEAVKPDDRISTFRISVTVNASVPYGPFDQWITIKTDDTFDPDKRVNLRGYVRQLMECDRTRVAMGIIRNGTTKTERIEIFSPYGKPFTIDRVENAKGNRCKWKLEKINDANYELAIAIEGEECQLPTVVSEEVSVYGVAEDAQVRQDIQVFAMLQM